MQTEAGTPFYAPPTPVAPADEVEDTQVVDDPPPVGPHESQDELPFLEPEFPASQLDARQDCQDAGPDQYLDSGATGLEVQPPTFLSAAAADQRLRRLMTPKANGEYKVPMEVVNQYKESKDSVQKLFEKCGHDRDQGLKNVMAEFDRCSICFAGLEVT